MQFPKYNISLCLSHNEYKNYYSSIETAVEDHTVREFWLVGEKEKALATGDIWELQWYPSTPIGFHKVVGASLEVVMSAAINIDTPST